MQYVEIAARYGSIESMELSRQLDKMDAAELRNLTATLLAELAERDTNAPLTQPSSRTQSQSN